MDARAGIAYKNSFVPQRIVEPMTDDCLIWSSSEEAWPFREKAKPCPRGHTPQFMGMGAGRYIMDVLAARVGKVKVDVRCSTRAIALIADGSNRVHGVVGRSKTRPATYARAPGSRPVPAASS